jgi:hypothetical protein
MIAADDIGIGGEESAAADRHAAGGKELAVEADIGVVAQLDIAVLAREDCVASNEYAVPDPDAAVRLALGVHEAVVVDDHIVADMNLVGVAEHDVLAENHVSAARAEQERIERLAQDETERPRARLREGDDKLVLQERRETRRPTTSASYF